MSFKTFALVIVNALLLVAGQVFWKKAVVQDGVGLGQLIANWMVWIGFAFFGLATLVWFYVLAAAPLSKALPLQSITYFLGLLAGILFFKETVSGASLLGTLCILVGVFLVSSS